MIISIFNPSFIWDHRNSIVQITTLAIPIAIELIHVGTKIYSNPTCIKESFIETKEELFHFFSQYSGEHIEAYHNRLICQISCLALKTILVAGSGAAAYLLAPPAYSIACALIAIQVVGKVLSALEQTPEMIKKASSYIQDAFHQRKGESLESFQDRREEALKKISLCSFIFAASLGVIGAGGYIFYLLAHAKSIWGLTDVLPYQTPQIVFIEYALLGAGHAYLAARSWTKGENTSTIFHLISAISAIAFPLYYILDGGEVRLHHSFLGLSLQLLPWRPLKCLGSVITFDSFLNSYLGAQGIVRGRIVQYPWGKVTHQYDYQNALLAHLPFAVKSLASLCVFSRNVDYFLVENNSKSIAI